jgi:hypothetical protein
MNMALFYRGLLCAIAERRREIVVEGDGFHAAFRDMLTSAVEKNLDVPAAAMLENFDPVFGISPDALAMVCEGERDFILDLHSAEPRRGRPSSARFKISDAEATRELGHLPFADLFRQLAATLDERSLARTSP